MVTQAFWVGSTILILLVLAACGPSAPPAPRSPQELLSAGATQAAQMAPPTATAFVIEYVVAGANTGGDQYVDIRWHSGTGQEETESKIDITSRVWSRFITVKPGTELMIEATSHLPGDDRPVRCEIYLSGQLWDSDDTNGNDDRASCSAIAGW